jgi:hypothetical protein
MACEFLGQEYRKDKGRILHVRSFCTATDQPCLVDEPCGPESCCRRTWLLMQKTSAPLSEAHQKRSRRRDKAQYAMLGPVIGQSGQNQPKGDSLGCHVSVLTNNGHNRASTSFPPESESERGERARNQTEHRSVRLNFREPERARAIAK